ncbi:MAG: GDP-mannose 4,6-dehydratase, partial [Acidimicrobiales bacterium]
VVAGGAGFLGSHLCERLIERGDEVIALDNLITGSLENLERLFGHPGFTFQHQDVSNHVHVSGPIAAVMNLASPASPKDFTEIPIPILKVGALGTHNLLGLAKEKGARFFQASTSEVYGDPLVHPQPESYWGHVNPIGPRGVYDEAKRFGEAMVMAYHRHHGLDVRIVRIFNSILADEQVLYDDGTELRREPVEKLAERLSGAVDLHGYTVPAFAPDGLIGAAEATALVGHPPSGPCYEVALRYGRTIKVTGDHSLFVEGGGGIPEARPVSQLAVGDRVAIAGRVVVPVRERSFVRMTDVWNRTGGDPWRLMVRAPELEELVWRRRAEVFDAIAAVERRDSPVWRSEIWGAIARHRDRSQLPLGAMRSLGITVPPEATVRLRTAGRAAELPELVHLSDEMLWLLGLYVAEGCRCSKAGKSDYIAISCEEAVLRRARKVIERDLNLHVVDAPANASRGGAIFVHSRLLLALMDDLGFSSGPKRIPGWVLGLPLSRLKWFLEGYREGDGVHSGLKLEAGVRHEFSTISTELKDDLVVAFARFGLVPSVGRYETTFNQRTGERRYSFWRLTLPAVRPWSPLEWDGGVQQTLQARRTGDIVWAPVKSITEVEPTVLVYDFCVPGRENFWAGGGVLAHNTYGPRMRPDDGRVVSNFLVQALAGKPLTLYGQGEQTRSFCYVDDEVEGFLRLLDSDHIGPVNIGNPNEFTVRELADLVLEITGSRSELSFEAMPVDDPARRQPDITLAREVLGWEPEVQLAEGLRRTAEHFRTILR